MSLVAHKYTPGEMSAHELEATFAARGETVEYLLSSLRQQIKSSTLSSFVITGPRGSGKSTIIRMVVLRIGQDPKLEKAWLPVVFPEEQFNIVSLRDLMAATLQMLAKQEISPAQTWLDKVEAEAREEQSLQLALTGLREITRQHRKRLILFIENLNQLLEDCLDDQMKGTFRRLLMIDPFMMVIGSAVHVFESLKSYEEAFYNYFGQVPLGRLTDEEVFALLKRRADFDGDLDFLKDLPSQKSKVRAIVLLSGGNPRLILMLYELLTQRHVTTIVQYLQRLVDELTPLFKHEIENLPPQQRLIIHALMERGGAAQPTDLVAQTRLPLNAITTQLGRLKESQFVEVLGGGKGRTANYTVSDKLFAVWYQMRYLGQNRRRIELFVEVLRIWFEEEERLSTLRKLASPEHSGVVQALTPKEHLALLSRSLYKRRLDDTQGAVSDCAAVIDMVEVPEDQRAVAYFGRWLAFREGNKTWVNVDDLLKVIDLAVTKLDFAVSAAEIAYFLLFLRKDYSGAEATIKRLSSALNSAPQESARTSSLRFLNDIASPELKDAWPTAWRILAKSQRSGIVEALQLLKPVCDVLEGKERAVLDGLPPEQREFAENVLKRFEAKPKSADEHG
ncbi:MAG: AAA family ATPase [Limisphaerales bacterium]